MKNTSGTIKTFVFRVIFGVVLIISVSMITDSGSAQDKLNQKCNKKSDLLNKLEKGENVTLEELKSAFSNEGERKDASYEYEQPYIPFYGILPWHNYVFEFEVPDFQEIPSLSEVPSFPEYHPGPFDFRFRYSDRRGSIPGMVDEWDSEGFREEISKAMEEARKNFEKFREGDWMKIQEEMRKSMEDMKKEMDMLREKNRNDKEEKQSIVGIPII